MFYIILSLGIITLKSSFNYQLWYCFTKALTVTAGHVEHNKSQGSKNINCTMYYSSLGYICA